MGKQISRSILPTLQISLNTCNAGMISRELDGLYGEKKLQNDYAYCRKHMIGTGVKSILWVWGK